MSRRSGLGRGLAALIPPSVPVDEDPTPSEASAPDPSDTSDGSSDPLVSASSDDRAPAEPSAEPDVAEPSVDEPPTERAVEASAAGEAVDDSSGDETDDDATTAPVADSPVRAVPGTSAPMSDAPSAPATAPASSASVEADAQEGEADVRPPESVADDGHVPAAAATLAEVAPASIQPNPRQPREVFDPEELEHLATSLADIGVLQPLVVRPLGDGRYELVAGERRLRAATLAGLGTVPVVIRHTEDADLLKEALVENIHRVQLNPLEEGAAYQQLLEEFGVTQEELATTLGRSRPAISNAIRLLQLPAGVQRRVASGVLSAGHAKVLLAIEDPAQQVRLADRIVAEGMSVRATEELVRLRLLDGPVSSPAPRRKHVTAPGLVELQDDLSDALEARVRISMGTKRGKLAIDFASVDDLERIVSIIANGLEGGGVASTVTPDAAGEPGTVRPEPT